MFSCFLFSITLRDTSRLTDYDHEGSNEQDHQWGALHPGVILDYQRPQIGAGKKKLIDHPTTPKLLVNYKGHINAMLCLFFICKYKVFWNKKGMHNFEEKQLK